MGIPLGPLGSILNIGETVINRLIPDKNAQAAAKQQLLAMATQGELNETIAQLDVNKAEAASNSIFVAGWRPFVGWACGAAMAYVYIVQPICVTLIDVVQCVLRHTPFDKSMLPIIDLSQMWPVLLGMLGMGALRTADKLGVQILGGGKDVSNGH